MRELKYKITNIKISYKCRKLYRIKALKDFGDVKKGDFGGYVEHPDNLSHRGNCWIYDKAKVYDDALVFDNAKIKNQSEVYHFAKIFENATIEHYAKIYHNAVIDDNARVAYWAEIGGNAWVDGNSNVVGYSSIFGYSKVTNEFVCDDQIIKRVNKKDLEN